MLMFTPSCCISAYKCSSARTCGWMPMWLAMMNSRRASPTPSLGSEAKSNACSGVSGRARVRAKVR